MLRSTLCALSLGAFLVACESKPAVPPPGKTPGAMPSGHPTSMPSSAPAEKIPLKPGEGVAAGKPFSGLIKLGEGVTEADLKGSDVLFIMARTSQGEGLAGSLVAVQRVMNAKYPLRYEMSAKDLMMPAVPFSGPFIVHARLDRDGDPMTRDANDLYGSFAGEVANGDEGVHMVLVKKTMDQIELKPPGGAPSSAPAPAPPAAPASQPK